MRLAIIVLFSSFLGALMSTVVSYGDSNSLFSVAGGIVRTSHVNQYFQALSQNVVPRNSSGIPTSNAGTMGSSSLPWKHAHITTGYWSPGDIKCHHTYNGLLPMGQGWMRMDGDIINETNYDAEHGAGSWDLYVVSSLLDGRYLPALSVVGNGKYIQAASTTPQDGTAPFTDTGNPSNLVDISHTHSVQIPALGWYDENGASPDTTFNSGGGSTALTTNTNGNGIPYIACSAGNPCIGSGGGLFYTQGPLINTGIPSLSPYTFLTQVPTKPHSVEFVCYMRIV